MPALPEQFDPSTVNAPRFDALPDIPAIQLLKSRRQWVAWKYEDRGGPKPTKPPISPATGFKASHSEPKHWGDYNDAVTRVIRSGLEGVGYVLTEDDNLSGGDLDHCRNAETGELEPWAAAIVDLKETYVEVSPSGEGLRILWLGKVADAIKCDPAGVEVYGRQRYLTITGDHLAGTPAEIREAPRTEAALRKRAAKFNAPPAAEQPNDFFRKVNTAALASISSWATAIFPQARFQKGTGAYRVAAKHLGDGWQEDLSISPKGIVYFGPADQGDGRQGKRTPIDLAIEFGGQRDATKAAHWLCDRMGTSPQLYGWSDDAKAAELANQLLTNPQADEFDATPWAEVDPASIPRRQWLYGKHYIRKFVTTTISPGGIGKTSLVIAEAIAMVTGWPVLGVVPEELSRVWVWNGEDPLEEIQKRVLATCQLNNIEQSQLKGLFVDSGRQRQIVLAQETRNGAVINAPIHDKVVNTILKNKIDVFIVDPFVSSHQVNENDNNSIDLVAKAWAHIADVTNCSIELVHHARKTGGQEVTVEHARGAVALISAARSARTLNGMTEDEEAKAGKKHVSDRRQFFRVDNGKANLTLPPNRSTWFKMTSVRLPNSDGGLLDNGDEIGVPALWEWPNSFEGVSEADLRQAQEIIGDKPMWRADIQSPDWVGYALTGIWGLDTSKKTDKAQLNSIIKGWLARGVLKTVDAPDHKRDMRTWVVVP